MGKNGSGKTTLLNLISGTLLPTTGTISRSFESQTRISSRLEGDLFPASTREIFEKMCVYEISGDPRYGKLVSQFADLGGFEKLNLFEQKLKKIGFDPSLLNTPEKLSGGWRGFVPLFAALHSNAPLILWDEPTNFLDLEKRILLKNANLGSKSTLVFSSHDRELMSLTTHILEISTALENLIL